MIFKKQCLLLLVLCVNFVALTSEKSTRKTEKFNAIKSLHEYLDDLERERLQKKSSLIGGTNLQHGGDYVAIKKKDAQDRRFGRGSSGNAKL